MDYYVVTGRCPGACYSTAEDAGADDGDGAVLDGGGGPGGHF